MRYRALKHGSEEEYDMFEDFAICRARNRRMNGAADSRLQLEHITPTPTGEDEHNAAAITPDTRREGGDSTVPEDSSICAEDGKLSQENIDTTATLLKLAARNYEDKEIRNPIQRQGDHHLCTQAEEAIQPADPSTPSNPAGT